LPKNILLVEPNYYTRFPPVGLLKLSSYHKKMGDYTELIKGQGHPKKPPDVIYVTSLFTWAWEPVWDAVKYYKANFPSAKIILGGLYASLLPEHAALSGADEIHKGIVEEVEDLIPDYTLVPDWNGSIIFSSRGCNMNCGFCAVPILEGKLKCTKKSIKHLVWPGHTRIIFFDNNLLQNPHWRDIFDELEDLKMSVDFNQGLDARLITDEVAERMANLKIDSWIRLAYDARDRGKYVKRAIDNLSAVGIRKRRIMVYTLFNYNDTPSDFFERVKEILNWGVVCYPMRYEPIFALKKNEYISPNWSKERLGAVQRARRVIGYGGSFPPYEGLIRKFNAAKDFDEAFKLRPPKRG